jgi:hypothetical protein
MTLNVVLLQARTLISKVTEERNSVIQQNKRLQQELVWHLLRKYYFKDFFFLKNRFLSLMFSRVIFMLWIWLYFTIFLLRLSSLSGLLICSCFMLFNYLHEHIKPCEFFKAFGSAECYPYRLISVINFVKIYIMAKLLL